MRRALGRLRTADPVVFVIAALLCASTLVIFFHHRALGALERQTTVILQKVAEQTAAAVAVEVRQIFDGPVFDTLAGITHPHLVAGRLDLVTAAYRKGLVRYPQVERFFAWTRETEQDVPGEAVFYAPQLATPEPPISLRLRDFHRHPALGTLILEAARQHAGARQIYAAVASRVDDVPYQIFLRLYYTDATRNRYFAVLGFAVNLNHVRTGLFREIHARQLGELLEPGDGTPPFDMRIFDDAGRLVYGPSDPASTISASSSFALQFYPVDDIRTRMAALVPTRDWSIVISPRPESASRLLAATPAQSYWLSGLTLLLMLIALVFAIQTSHRAAQLGRMQSEFVAHVSHQLKTPVSLLSVVTETLSMDRVRSPEKLAQCVEIIRGQTVRLSTLIERILDFSRVAERRRRYELEAVRLETLVRETVEAFVSALETSGYQISVVGPASTPIVAADPAALEQALLNLLDNAIKYSGESRKVTVRVAVAGTDAIVDVADHGIGIDPADRHRIFDRFYRGAGGAMSPHGFGLGLPIASEIVTAHRGRIEVDTTPGGGSTFRIRIPLLQDRAPQSEGSLAWVWRGREKAS